MTDETREKLKDIIKKKPLQTSILITPEYERGHAAGKVEGWNEGLAAALEFLRKDQDENYHGWVDGQLEYYKKELEGLKR